MANNGKDTKHTRYIGRRMHFVRNGEKCKMQKIDWCEGGLQLADIGTKNVIGGRYPNLKKTIMLKTGANVTSGEGIWRPRDKIFGVLLNKSFDAVWSHRSAVMVQITKYLCEKIT